MKDLIETALNVLKEGNERYGIRVSYFKNTGAVIVNVIDIDNKDNIWDKKIDQYFVKELTGITDPEVGMGLGNSSITNKYFEENPSVGKKIAKVANKLKSRKVAGSYIIENPHFSDPMGAAKWFVSKL